MRKTMELLCPCCETKRVFIRVIEAHSEIDPSQRDGEPLRKSLVATELPLAYCQKCKVVVYVGPSPEEVSAAAATDNLVQLFDNRRALAHVPA